MPPSRAYFSAPYAASTGLRESKSVAALTYRPSDASGASALAIDRTHSRSAGSISVTGRTPIMNTPNRADRPPLKAVASSGTCEYAPSSR